jgi:hypothetical protein
VSVVAVSPVSIRLPTASPSPPLTSDGRAPRRPTSQPDSGAATNAVAAIGSV